MKRKLFIQFSYSLFYIFVLVLPNATDGQVIDYSTTVKIEKGKKITERLFLIQINDKEQNWLSKVRISYTSNQKFELLEASIIDQYGKTIRNIKKKEITTKSAVSYGTFFEDNFLKEFVLNWNNYPYRIKYKYRITENNFLYVANWYPLIYNNIEIKQARLYVELPINFQVSIAQNGIFKHKIYQVGNKKILQWELTSFKNAKPEIFSPPTQETVPNVTIVPKKFKYVVPGNSNTWSAYGEWNSLLNEGAYLLPESEKIKVNELIKGIKDKKKIIKILYHYLQDNTRYINVAIDEGGLKPYPATYVCKNKYGDCKALTVYMKALLKQAGIPSIYTVINAGSNPIRINQDLPSQQFNHVILFVPVNNDTIWLENTTNFLPVNYLGTFTQDRIALLIDGKNSRLIRTPKLEIKDVLEKKTYVFKLNEDGNGTLNINEKLRGEAFESNIYYMHTLNKKEQKQRIISNLRVKHLEATEWSIRQTDRDKKDVGVYLTANCFNQFREIGKLKVIQPVMIKIPLFEDTTLRKKPVRINFPINKADSSVYILPFIGKYKIELPKATSLKTPYGEYTNRFSRKGSKIVFLEDFKLYPGNYPLKEYGKFYLFIKSILKSQSQSVIILTKK